MGVCNREKKASRGSLRFTNHAGALRAVFPTVRYPTPPHRRRLGKMLGDFGLCVELNLEKMREANNETIKALSHELPNPILYSRDSQPKN